MPAPFPGGRGQGGGGGGLGVFNRAAPALPAQVCPTVLPTQVCPARLALGGPRVAAGLGKPQSKGAG
jgi:hypothetical protein